jgi:hypothetical protein
LADPRRGQGANLISTDLGSHLASFEIPTLTPLAVAAESVEKDGASTGGLSGLVVLKPEHFGYERID